MLDPIAFAHWIMGDGSKLAPGLVLCTDSFYSSRCSSPYECTYNTIRFNLYIT